MFKQTKLHASKRPITKSKAESRKLTYVTAGYDFEPREAGELRLSKSQQKYTAPMFKQTKLHASKRPITKAKAESRKLTYVTAGYDFEPSEAGELRLSKSQQKYTAPSVYLRSNR